MPVVAAALRGGQGSESAVRLGNDNIEHARPPRTVWQHFDARFRGRVSQDPRWADVASVRLTYLEPGAPGVYHPFASRYFAKLPGVYPHGAVAKKKTVARFSESLRFAREMAESTECSTCNRIGGRRGTATGRCAAAFRRRCHGPHS